MMIKPLQRLHLLNGGSFSFPFSTKQVLLGFVALSFAATAFDVALAHSQSRFIPVYEWIPVFYPLLAAAITLYYLFRPGDKIALYGYIIAMATGIITGLAGFFFHIIGNSVNSIFLWNWFIFGAPVLAPLTITGMSVLGLALINPDRRVLLRLISLGFLVLALTAFLDHAQTHFASYYTWIPVLSGILGFWVTWFAGGQVNDSSLETGGSNNLGNLFYSVMLLMIGVGMVGAYLHIATDLHATVKLPWRRFLYLAPVLAPLLFAQLGTLGFLCSLRQEDLDSDGKLTEH